MKIRFLCVGGPLDGQYVEDKPKEFEVVVQGKVPFFCGYRPTVLVKESTISGDKILMEKVLYVQQIIGYGNWKKFVYAPYGMRIPDILERVFNFYKPIEKEREEDE